DLCLSCKGCKGECPVDVDMATYKAEFLSHYYEGRLRPRSAYVFGLVYWWARAASHAPGVANFLTQAPLLRGLAKAIAGAAPQRRLPAFAAVPFTRWFRKRPVGAALCGRPGRGDAEGDGQEKQGGHIGPPLQEKRVLLWPDTFNNYFHPETAQAAVEVLESAGYNVAIPAKPLCCGRPLYDFGMLGLARRQLRQILDALRDDIRAGTPVVGLEPSCVAVFRDELTNLFPEDEDAQRLSRQTLLLSEFLAQESDHVSLPRLHGKAIVHGHCHEKAILQLGDTKKILGDLGLDVEVIDSGCCGMAGSFGFEAGEHYDVSMKVGEQVLLPAVREAPEDVWIVTNGFSCREQIAQATGRRALHFAQVLQQALRANTRPGDKPPGRSTPPA